MEISFLAPVVFIVELRIHIDEVSLISTMPSVCILNCVKDNGVQLLHESIELITEISSQVHAPVVGFIRVIAGAPLVKGSFVAVGVVSVEEQRITCYI